MRNGTRHLKELCTVEKCENPQKARGWCHTHYWRWQTHGDTGTNELKRPQKISVSAVCRIGNCEESVRSLNLCGSHYSKQHKYGNPLWEKPVTYDCSEPQCKRPHLAKGLCALHYGRKYQEANKDKSNANVAKRRKENPEKFRAYWNNYRTLKLEGSVFLITDKELKKLLASPCFYCHKVAKIEIDHVIPLSRGGRHSIGNIVPACRSCNASKSDRLITEWRLRIGRSGFCIL